MKSILAPLLVGLAMTYAPAQGALSPAQLDTVDVAPPPGARLDPKLTAPDASGRMRTLADVFDGRPSFVNFVDYTCTTLCGTDLALLSQATARNHLGSSHYRIIVIGIDPKDTPQSALAMEHKEIPAALWPTTTLLLPNAEVVREATAALGFRYVYDRAIDQFAHPAVIYLVGPDGRLRRTLSPFALSGTNLRAALKSSAAEPDLFQRVQLLCYAYDPATGQYTLRILTVLKIACILTVLMLAGTVIGLRRFRKRTT